MRRLIIGSLIGAAALWWTLRGQDVQLLSDAIARADLVWVAAALASVGMTLFVVTVRWQVLFGRGAAPSHAPRADSLAAPILRMPVPTLGALFPALILGQATNILLPIRIGELLRVYVASRTGGVPVSGVLATVVIERLSDMVMLAAGAAVLVLAVALPDWLNGPTRAVAVAGVLAAGTILAVVLAGGRISVWVRARVEASASKSKTLQRIAHHGALAADEAANLGDWRTLALVTVLSASVLVSSASTNYLLFLAFGLPIPAVGALLVLVILQVGTAPVSTPGNLGVFQYLTVLALSLYAVEGTAAVAYSVVLYAVALVPKLIVGGVVLGVVTKQGVLEPGIWNKLRGRA